MIKRPACPLPEETREERKPSHTDQPAPPLTREQAMAEAARCLSRHQCTGCEICELLCPDQAICKDPITGRPVIDLTYCKGCGLCAQFCPKGAIKMVQEAEEE